MFPRGSGISFPGNLVFVSQGIWYFFPREPGICFPGNLVGAVGVVGVEGREAREHLVDEDAQAPEVHLGGGGGYSDGGGRALIKEAALPPEVHLYEGGGDGGNGYTRQFLRCRN